MDNEGWVIIETLLSHLYDLRSLQVHQAAILDITHCIAIHVINA